eukprot:354286-Chlamydomonas_euryale.AAC.6
MPLLERGVGQAFGGDSAEDLRRGSAYVVGMWRGVAWGVKEQALSHRQLGATLGTRGCYTQTWANLRAASDEGVAGPAGNHARRTRSDATLRGRCAASDGEFRRVCGDGRGARTRRGDATRRAE